MKKYLLLLPVLALLFVACGPVATTDTAIEYNDEMIAIQSDVDQALVDVLDAIDTYDEDEMFDAQIDAIDACDEGRKTVEGMDDFDGSDDFKKEMIKLIDMYQGIIEDEIDDIIYYTIYSDDLTDDDWDEYYELYDVALDKYDVTFGEFQDFQKEFAEEWDFELE